MKDLGRRPTNGHAFVLMRNGAVLAVTQVREIADRWESEDGQYTIEVDNIT